MKKTYALAALFLLLGSFAIPLSASAACVPPHVSGGDGQCYSVDASGIWTRVPGETPGGGGTAVNVSGNPLKSYSDAFISLVNDIVMPVLMAVALIVFLWGVYKGFILGGADEVARTSGRHFVMWGVIGFIVILSVWGLLGIITGTLGLPSGGTAPAPPLL